jgi:hypothetical protein
MSVILGITLIILIFLITIALIIGVDGHLKDKEREMEYLRKIKPIAPKREDYQTDIEFDLANQLYEYKLKEYSKLESIVCGGSR